MSTKRTKLKTLRHDKGLSQESLAKEIGASRESISLWERGIADPHPHHIKKLCTFFEKEAAELDLQISSTTPDLSSTLLNPNQNDVTAFTESIVQAFTHLGPQEMDPLRRHLLQIIITSAGKPLLFPSYTISPMNAFNSLERLAYVLQRPSSIDNETMSNLEATTLSKRYRFVSEGITGYELLQETSAHLNTITHLLESSQPTHRYTTLCMLASETALLLGDMLFNADDNQSAGAYYNTALALSKEIRHNVLQAVILGRKSFLPIYEEYPQYAFPFLDEAQSLVDHMTADSVTSWLWAIRSEAHAKAQDHEKAKKAIEIAENLITRNISGNISYAFQENIAYALMGPLKLLGYKGVCFIEGKKSESARMILQQYLTYINAESKSTHLHHKSITLTDLAMTYIQQLEIKEACQCASQSIACIAQTGSARVFQRVLKLRQTFRPWDHMTYVKEVDEQLMTVIPLLQQGGNA